MHCTNLVSLLCLWCISALIPHENSSTFVNIQLLRFVFAAVLAEIEVYLIPPTSEPNTNARNKGTVLVRFNSTSAWGSICDDKWNLPDANVVCKMLGFP